MPYAVIAQLLGRDASFWERCEQSLSRISVVGSVCKTGSLPLHLAADEKVTYWNGQEAYVSLSSSGDCVFGAELSLKEDTAQLQEAYGVFAQEARDVEPTYQPQSVNLDGWKATNQAWSNLFPQITIVLCFLHAFLKIRDVGKGLKKEFHEIGNKVWQAYRQQTQSDRRCGFISGRNRGLIGLGFQPINSS
ncbi:MAG: hypothetical protein LH609_05765 [Rudanella sp.]|nr:hypothetical protein [Rudanella sp.]